MLLAAGCGDSGAPALPTPPVEPPPPSPEPEPEPPPDPDDRFAFWNTLPPEPWWRESAPYSCEEEENPNSPWLAAGLPDLGGSDALSLIRSFGNRSYVRYGHMNFGGCTASARDPNGYYNDQPIDPTYYSRGELEILVDLARVPPDASGWRNDDGTRVDLSMERVIALLNQYVSAYYRRISGNQFRITFLAGEEFVAPGDGSLAAVEDHQYQLVGACVEGCPHGAPGGLNRLLLHDVASVTFGTGVDGRAFLSLWRFANSHMGHIVHEIGHAWMRWPHSFWELPWRNPRGTLEPPNPYSNHHDVMSSTFLSGVRAWDVELPSTLAINRYSAGWIPPEDVALHLEERATYTLARPQQPGTQFLVVHSGRRHAFTTLEVLPEFPPAYRHPRSVVQEGSGRRRPLRYEGVFVARYDQSAGTGTSARFGPALHNRDNPDYLEDVGDGYDDHSVITAGGGSRDIGGGVTVRVSQNRDGSYDVTVAGGRTAEFERWCPRLWFLPGFEYDTGCSLDDVVWE